MRVRSHVGCHPLLRSLSGADCTTLYQPWWNCHVRGVRMVWTEHYECVRLGAMCCERVQAQKGEAVDLTALYYGMDQAEPFPAVAAVRAALLATGWSAADITAAVLPKLRAWLAKHHRERLALLKRECASLSCCV